MTRTGSSSSAGTTDPGAGARRRPAGVPVLAALALAALILSQCASKQLYLPGHTHPGDVWLQPGGDAPGLGVVSPGPQPPLRLAWRQEVGKPPVGGPLLDGRLLLQLTGGSRLVAFELASGRRVGRRGFTEDWCAPLAAAGPEAELLIACTSGDDPEVRAFDRLAGGWRWRLELASCAAPAARGDTLVVVTESGAAVAVRASSGDQVWRWEGEGLIAVPPAWRGPWVCVADARGHVALLAAGTGRLRWQRDLASGVRARPALAGDACYLTTAASQVACLDAASGAVRWQTPLAGLLTGVSLGARHAVVGSSDGHVYGLERATGSVVWRYDTGGVVRGAPALAGATVYVAGAGSALVALEADSGRLRWDWPLDGPVAAPVSVGATLVAVATERGSVYLFTGEAGGDAP